jgi:hypothetical protein
MTAAKKILYLKSYYNSKKKWKENIKIHFKGTQWDVVDLTDLDQYNDYWRALVFCSLLNNAFSVT